MYFDSLNDFLSMGGHGLYVWLAYGVTLAVLVMNYLSVYRGRKRQLAQMNWQRQREAAQSPDSGSLR